MSGCVVAVCFNNILHPTIFSWYFLKHVCRFISEICWKIVKIHSDKVFVFSYAVHFSLLNTFVYIVDPDIRVQCTLHIIWLHFFCATLWMCVCLFFILKFSMVFVCLSSWNKKKHRFYLCAFSSIAFVVFGVFCFVLLLLSISFDRIDILFWIYKTIKFKNKTARTRKIPCALYSNANSVLDEKDSMDRTLGVLGNF